MDTSDLIASVAKVVQETLAGDVTGHDWWHIHRVHNLAMQIAKKEKAHLIIVELAALLHDIADWKAHDGDQQAGPKKSRQILCDLGVKTNIVDPVCDIIATMSFKGAGVTSSMQTLEGQVVQDADRLDAMGAIGIARAFAYGGAKGRSLHNPMEQPVLHKTAQAYFGAKGTTINHFYEKLLLLRDLMNTSTGKALAHERHVFLETFLSQFFREWDPTNS